MSRELDEWRRRTAAAGLDVERLEAAARRQRGLPPLAVAPSAPKAGDGSQPRARRGDPAARPDRASREGVAQSGSALWDRLRSIAESDLGDDEKRDLYESVGVDEDRVRRVLAQIELGEAVESEPVDAEVNGMAARLERRFGPPQNEAQRAYIEQFRAQDEVLAQQQREQRDARLAAQLDAQRAELERDEPWWMTALKVIDKPRAVVVAGFSQLGAALDGDDETVASWDRFAEQVGDNVTVSSLIDEDMMPGWARFVLGFGVDVALDPLTYLTGGSAAVAKVAGKGGLKAANILVRASDDAAEAAIRATQAGDAATAAVKLAEADEFLKLSGRVGEVGGFGGLSQPERLVLERAAKATGTIGEGKSLRGGVYFRLPGTEGIRIPGLSEALTPVSRATARGTVGLRGTKFWERVSHPFETPRRQFLQQFSRSSLRQQKEALSAYRGVTLGTMRKAKFVEQMQSVRSGLLVETQRLGVDGGDMLRYLDAPDSVGADRLLNPVARLIADEANVDGPVTNLAAGWRNFFERARNEANTLAGEEWLRKVDDNYSFHVLDLLDEGEDALEAASRLSGGAGGRQPIGPEMRRSIQPGRNYRGVEIMEADDPRNLERFGAALSPEDQALEILRRTGAVDEADRLFSKDLAGVSELYVNSLGSRLQNRVVAKSLRDDGVGMAADRFARMQYGAAVVEQNMFVRKERFGAQVAAWRQAAGDGISVTADIGAAYEALARAVNGAGNVDELDAALKLVSDRLGFMSPRAGALGDELDGAMRRLATEAERAFRDGDAAEVFDLASVGIGNRSAQHIEAIEAVQDELAQMAAGLDTLGLARVDEALTAIEERVLLSRAQLFRDFDQQAVGRNLEAEVADRAAVAAQRVFYDELLDRVQVLRSGLTQAGELARRVDKTVAGAISDLGRFERALLPGSDGVARLSNGAVARFTRTGRGVRGAAVSDRVGVRFPLADDVDAADARFLGNVFDFTASGGRPLTYSGPTANAQMNADILLAGTRNRLMPLQKAALSTDNVFADSLLWNQFVELTQRAATTNTPPSVFVDTLNGLVRRYAALDADSFAARVVASSDNPAETLLDGVLNRNALSVVERADMGLWDEFMEGVTVNGDQLAKTYRSDLSKRGWDGVLLDDGATRELVSFGPQQMRAENEASRILLRIEGEQAKMGSRLNDLRLKFQSTADRMVVKPELLDGNARSAAAASRASQKRVASLGQKRAREGLSAAEDAELVMRGGANDAFKLANQAEREADQLVAAAKSARQAEVRQAQAADLEVGPPPPKDPRINELRNEAKNLRLLAQSDVAEADLLAAGVPRDFDFVFTGKLAETPGLAERMTEMLTQNMKALNDFTLAPTQIVDVLNATARLQNPEEVRKLLRAWDYITGVFKSYAVMTTGFITRNAVGAAMNNWLGLVNIKSYPEFFRADDIFMKALRGGSTPAKALEAVGKRFGERGKAAYQAWTEMAAGSAGGLAAQWAGDVGVAAADAIERTGRIAAARGTGWRNQGLRDNSLTRAFFYENTRMEYRVRGVMAWDEVYRKGGDMQSAIDRVYQFHFDYSPSGMSRFESGTLRRIIPFYVWTANNLPLQLKGLVTRPKVAASYLKFKQNMEELSEDQGIVPDYFGRLGAIRMPWTNSDGNNVYFMPDLPFRDLGMFGSIKPTVNPIDFVSNLVNMDEIKGMLNPIIRVPAETLIADEKFFSGAPFREGFVSMGALGRIPGLGPALGAMGQARKDKDGNWLVNEKNLYAIESFMPMVSRATRLFPTDDKGREKVWSAWLSTFVGVGFRTNTWTEQSNQLFRLQDRLNTEMRSRETLGNEFPTKTEIQRRNTEDAQVASLGEYAPETDFLLRILNSGDVEAIADLDGFGDESAARVAASVAASGAFTDARDLVTAKDVSVSGVERAVQSLRERSEYTLDIGTADAVELEAMPNIGPKTVEKILALRQRGGLVSLGSLRQVGLSARQIEEIRAWIDEQRQFQAQMAGVL